MVAVAEPEGPVTLCRRLYGVPPVLHVGLRASTQRSQRLGPRTFAHIDHKSDCTHSVDIQSLQGLLLPAWKGAQLEPPLMS